MLEDILHVGTVRHTQTKEGNTLIENLTQSSWTLVDPQGNVLDDSRWTDRMREGVRGGTCEEPRP